MFIITGSGRSGTGMLAALFGGHHEFRVPWILEKYAGPGRRPFRGFQERLSAVLDLHQGIDPSGFVDASNLYIYLLDALWALYPDLRILLGVRDGRDFVRSAISRGWHERRGFDTCPEPGTPAESRWKTMSPVERAAWIWADRNGRALSVLETLPESCWRIVRVEDLERNETLVDLARFSGVAVADAAAPSRGVNANPVHGFPAKEQWDDEDRRAFDRMAGSMMGRLGYSF